MEEAIENKRNKRNVVAETRSSTNVGKVLWSFHAIYHSDIHLNLSTKA
jgi:uncharacterized protein YueI